MQTVHVRSLTTMGVWSRVPALRHTQYAPRYAARVRVKRGNEWVDITNRVAEGTIVESNDRPVATLDLTLHNGTEYPSLAPHVKTSPLNIVNGKYDPLLDRYNEILVEAAVSYDGSEPTEFIPMFGGYLGDRTDTRHIPESGVTLPLSVRNYAKQLQDDYIMGPIELDGGEWASVLIQQLLTMRYDEGHLPELITLRVIGTDDFWIDKPWKVEGESTWDAIQKFAQQSNKDIRHMLDESTGEIRLTYWTPSTAMVPGWFIDAKDIRREELETSDAGNRYRVIVHWRDESGELQSTVCEDLSHRKPNEPIREMSIGEEHTELISDEAGAIRFGNAVLNGTKSPPATTRLLVPFNPYMRLHDVVQLTNEDVRSEPEVYAVEEIRRSFDPYNWNMELVASDSVKLRPEYWLSIEDRPGVAGETLPPEKIGGGNVVMPKPKNVVVSPMELGIAVHVPVPPVNPNRWSITEVYVSTTQGFTPSPETRTAANRSTYIPVTGLQPSQPYYVRTMYVDINGDRSEPSDEHEATPTRITGEMIDGDLFAIEATSSPPPSSGDLEDLWDMDPNTGVTFPSAPTITFTYPVYQGSDVVEMHLGGNAQGYVQMRQRDTGNWINVLGSPSSPVSFVQGWNYHRFTGNKLYFGREYRLVLLQNVRVNELRFERVTVADLIRAGKLRLTGDMAIEGPDGSLRIGDVGGEPWGYDPSTNQPVPLEPGTLGIWGEKAGVFLQGYLRVLSVKALTVQQSFQGGNIPKGQIVDLIRGQHGIPAQGPIEVLPGRMVAGLLIPRGDGPTSIGSTNWTLYSWRATVLADKVGGGSASDLFVGPGSYDNWSVWAEKRMVMMEDGFVPSGLASMLFWFVLVEMDAEDVSTPIRR